MPIKNIKIEDKEVKTTTEIKTPVGKYKTEDIEKSRSVSISGDALNGSDVQDIRPLSDGNKKK